MAITKLITAEYVRQYGYATDLVDARYLNPAIEVVQEDRIQRRLGTRLYEALMAEAAANPSGLPVGVWKSLNGYVQPMLRAFAEAYALTTASTKWFAKGAVRESGENDVPATLGELSVLINRLEEEGRNHDARLLRFLCKNEADYPLYTNYTITDGELPPSRKPDLMIRGTLFI